MNRFLALASLVAATVALVRSVFDFQAPGRMPLADLLRDRFRRPTALGREVVTGAVLGVAVVGLPTLALALAGWVELEQRQAGAMLSGLWVLAVLATIAIKLLWAALEELIFRGALLVQLARYVPAMVALFVSALFFGFAHLSRSGERAPGLLSLTVLVLDGIGFGIAYLATRSLWLPTAWHTSKNLMIWLLFGGSSMELVEGPWRVRTTGPLLWVGAPYQAGFVDAIVSASIVLVVALAYRRRIRAGLEWIARPPEDRSQQ
jgi:CAAX protease family protein